MLSIFRAVFAPPRDLILLVASAWIGLMLADRRARYTPIGERRLDTLVGAMTLSFLIGGRVLYLAEHLSAFIGSPGSIVSLDAALFDQWGGLACAAIAAFVVLQRMRLPLWPALDLLAILFATLGIGLGLSHLASGAAFGKETGVPWAVNLWGAQRHPTQAYEVLAELAILGILSLRREHGQAGTTFLLWAALTAAARLLIEGFRGDSTLVFGGIRLAQIISWAALAAALVGLERLARARPAEEAPPATENERHAMPKRHGVP